MITLKVEGLEKLKSVFREAGNKAIDAIKIALRKSILLLEREVKIKTPVDTGRLRTSYKTDFTEFKTSLYPTVHYAFYVHEGTKAHVILPKVKKALFWRRAEHPVKKVQHPGIKPRKWMEKAVLASIEKIKRIFNEEIGKIFK